MKKETAKVHGFNHRGEGVGKILSGPDQGLTVFLPNTVPGDIVSFHMVERKKSFLRGSVTGLSEQGEGRVSPVCNVAGRCGGCTWQHVNYPLQLEWKRQLVRDAFSRIAGIEDCEIRPTIPSPKILCYRNKVEVPVTFSKGRLVSGFFEPFTHNVVPSEDCPIEHPLLRDLVKAMMKEINNRGYTAYSEKTGRGQIRHVVGRVGPGTGELMGILVANARDLKGAKTMARRLADAIGGLKSVVLNTNTKSTNVVFGDSEKLLYGRSYIEDILGREDIGLLKFRLSPRSFYQVNSDQAVSMYAAVLKAADLRPDDVVFDFYSGIGTITLFAARKAGLCVGVEEVGPAVKDARINAKINGVDNVRFVEGKAARVLGSLRHYGKPSVIILDPPRGGAEREVLEAAVRINPRKMIYASCNPATLARDLIPLSTHGWYPAYVQPLDMFPMTPHVETVVLLSHRKAQ